MAGFRAALRKLPPRTTIQILRKVFSLPAPAARLILNDVTRPRKSHRKWIRRESWNGAWSGCWIGENVRHLDDHSMQARVEKADIVFFNVHGGGFRIGTCTMFMDTYVKWITLLKEKYNVNAVIMSVDYRLAPEYKYPSPVEDVVGAYEYLVKTMGIDPAKIIATGDSAGAALVLEMLFLTHDPSMFEILTDEPVDDQEPHDAPLLSELPRPAGTVLISPLVTDETTSRSWATNIQYDYISQYTAKVIKRDYFEPLEPDQPPDTNQVLGIAKLQTGFQAFLSPHVLFFIGNREVLRDDALELAYKTQQDGVHCQIVVEDCVHDWFCVREVVRDEAILDRADTTFAEFCHGAVIAPQQLWETAVVSQERVPTGLGAVAELDETQEDEDDTDQEFFEAQTKQRSCMFNVVQD
ncbi:Alpha/Beta hydrolase protein [Radiomyces spectabilis]|uniref:Alpha/Beta hydrolase protein n=1 Tax=Radiomyces spectabilis TaxID=64574 RepID=UPI00222059DB|nr:Alpha/Beta hydrolase protein [Radiomyces spectabilis]KAI8371477.1 Alpha/Beta hydrolase protein [Radiomyces spectabilis]